jgi:hypothetical protein
MEKINESALSVMELVETFSRKLKTISWIWGGFTVDIYENRVLRKHDDLDYLTLNLHNLIPQFSEMFISCGWQVKVLENDDLKLVRDGIKVHLGHVEIADKARWTHNGDKGSIWFSSEWLDFQSVDFCGIEIHVVKPEFQFVMIERPQMLNPDWKLRDKDIAAQEYLRNNIESRGINPHTLLKQVYESAFQLS